MYQIYRKFCFFFCSTAICNIALLAQAEHTPVQELSQALSPPSPIEETQQAYNPWGAEVEYLATGKMKGKGNAKGNKVGFQQAEAKIHYNHQINDTQSILFGLGYEHSHLHLNKNPYFNRKNFGFVPLFVQFSTTQYDRWMWDVLVGAKIDSQRNKIRRYSEYRVQVKGRYAYSDNLGLHMGAVANMGLRRTQFLPIVGVDYAPNKEWKIKAIFPAKLAVNYRVDPNWSWELSGRLLQTRHRLSNREPNKEGIFDYRLYGTDLALQYHCEEALLAQVYAGWGFGSKLKIYDRSKNLYQSYKFKAAPYVGVMLQYQF